MKFKCGYCGKRFKTEGWKDKHEGKCGEVANEPQKPERVAATGDIDPLEELQRMEDLMDGYGRLSTAGKNWVRDRINHG